MSASARWCARLSPPGPSRDAGLPAQDLSAAADVGCNTGAFGEAVKQARPGTEVWGIEPTVARPSGRASTWIMCSRLLRRIAVAAGRALRRDLLQRRARAHARSVGGAAPCAQPADAGGRGGGVAANLLHLDTIWPLLHDHDFRYESSGVRDRTHLRFFTRVSALRMFEECGYEVLSVTGINEQWWNTTLRRAANVSVLWPLADGDQVRPVRLRRPARPPRGRTGAGHQSGDAAGVVNG
ncbi:hypothetical protein Ddc_18804 [Ditylenchus destructor]|nr:hypothetical protein Ddc_18804 [Ditylenchus destructor]